MRKQELQDCRTALRLPREQRQKIEKLIHDGEFKNISQLVRTALEEFLKEKALNPRVSA